jgi:hypothetical protein
MVVRVRVSPAGGRVLAWGPLRTGVRLVCPRRGGGGRLAVGCSLACQWPGACGQVGAALPGLALALAGRPLWTALSRPAGPKGRAGRRERLFITVNASARIESEAEVGRGDHFSHDARPRPSRVVRHGPGTGRFVAGDSDGAWAGVTYTICFSPIHFSPNTPFLNAKNL